jgi:hypothetical protein
MRVKSRSVAGLLASLDNAPLAPGHGIDKASVENAAVERDGTFSLPPRSYDRLVGLILVLAHAREIHVLFDGSI